jgi:hypothetical protein
MQMNFTFNGVKKQFLKCQSSVFASVINLGTSEFLFPLYWRLCGPQRHLNAVEKPKTKYLVLEDKGPSIPR